jgi:hypothetical protein
MVLEVVVERVLGARSATRLIITEARAESKRCYQSKYFHTFYILWSIIERCKTKQWSLELKH